MVFFALIWMINLDGVEVILPRTDVYNRLNYQTVARRPDDAFFVFDRFEQRILLFEPGKGQGQIIARKGPGPGELDRTNAIFLFKSELYVFSASCIQVFDLKGQFRHRFQLKSGVTAQKTATGWLTSKWDPLTDHLGLYLTNDALEGSVPVVRWDKNLPYQQIARPGKTIVVPVFSDIGGHVVSKDGERVFYRLPLKPNIHIYSILEKKNIGIIALKDRFPFDKARGEAKIERLQESLPRNKVKGEFPKYFPYTNGLLIDQEGYLVVKRFMGRSSKLFRFDQDGHPAPSPLLNLDQMKRVVGSDGQYLYISFQNHEMGDMGICRIHRQKAKDFIENNPVD